MVEVICGLEGFRLRPIAIRSHARLAVDEPHSDEAGGNPCDLGHRDGLVNTDDVAAVVVIWHTMQVRARRAGGNLRRRVSCDHL